MTRYEVTEQKVQRRSSVISHKERDCRITSNFGGWESMYFETFKGAEMFAHARWEALTKHDRYNCVFEIDEQEFVEMVYETLVTGRMTLDSAREELLG